MTIIMEEVFGRSSTLEIKKRNGKIEMYLDDIHDCVSTFFPNKESVDNAIDELIRLRNEIYPPDLQEILYRK